MTGDSRAHLAAALTFAASVALIVGSAPWWCVAIAFATVAWRALLATRRVAQPAAPRGVKFLFGAITAVLVIAVALSFRTLNGLAAGTALLVVMGALKLMESRSRRDDAIVVAVSLFLGLAAALATQALWRVPFYLLLVWGACASFALIAHGESLAPRAALRLSARALVMALPLAAACFVFFPRFGGQFWALQGGAAATTGLSDEMSPGSIDKIANEYEPAFRVAFQGPLPPREQLYWRGPVLNSFDGFTWRRDRTHFYATKAPTLLGDPVRYRVTLEPSNRVWMFALDTVAASPRRDVYLSHDRQLSAPDPITSPTSYDAVSYLATRYEQPLSTLGRRYETRIPEDRNPRARALALEIRARTGSDAEFSAAVLEWFRTQGLEYTLEPGTTTIDSVDTTLFDSRRGFCGHFASAFASMMRAAGVPARVVTGYLGGEWNPVGGYLIVRQSEAHAWTEIWLDGRGWTRVDPTAVVSPERLQRGAYDVLGASLPATSRLYRAAWISRINQLWDSANQWWQSRVVEFDVGAQFNLLRRLGIDAPAWQHLGWAFAIGLVAWILWVSLALRRSVARPRRDRIARAWLRATRRLARYAPRREASEGPLDYARRVGRARPELAARIEAFAAEYAALRFGRSASRERVAAFEEAARRLG